MKILVVHDRPEVADQVKDVIFDAVERPVVELAVDAVTAREALSKSYYDLLIIDLTIPNVSGRGPANYQPAEAVLEELFAASTLLVPGYVLGISQEADALLRIHSSIGSHLMAIVNEDSDGTWRRELSDRLNYIMASVRARSTAWLTKHDYDLLIVTALDKELAPLSELFELTPLPNYQGVSEFVFLDRTGAVRRGVCSAIGRAGQPSAASETQGLLCQLRPRLAIMIGFSGGVPDKARLGDILIAESAIDWDYGKWKPSELAARLYARPDPISIRNSTAHRIARNLVQAGVRLVDGLAEKTTYLSRGEVIEPALIMAPFASGSAVIGDNDVLDSIRSLNDSISGVDMESYGFYYACQHSRAAKPAFICIKAVADHCGPDKDDRLHTSCCFASAMVARHIATVEWSFA